MSRLRELSRTIFECKYHIVSDYVQLGKRYWGHDLWDRGYRVSAVSLDEEKIHKYVKYHERKDNDSEQGDLGLE